MAYWDEEASPYSTPLKALYYCTICEDFFELSPIAPLRCPWCYCDPRYIIGPIPAREVNLDKLDKVRREKYKGKLGR